MRLVTPTRRLLTCVISARLDIQEVEPLLQQARPALAAQLAHREIILRAIKQELRQPLDRAAAVLSDRMQILEGHLQLRPLRRALHVRLVTPIRRLVMCVTSARLDIQEVELPLLQARPAPAAQLAHLGHILLAIKQELRQPDDRALHALSDGMQTLAGHWQPRLLRHALLVRLVTPTRRLVMCVINA